MNRNHKTLLILTLLISACLTGAIIAQLTYGVDPTQRGYEGGAGGVGTSYTINTTIDNHLTRYVNLTAAIISSASGPGYSWNTADGEVNWIGNPNMTTRSLQNLHLTIYTTVDNNQTFGNLTLLQIGLHVLVNQTASQIPPNTLDHQEIIIPNLGTENPRYQYHFNCTSYIPPNPTASPTGNA